MIADIGGLYASLGARLRSVVGRQVNARSVVVEDACHVAWLRLVQNAQAIEADAALPWLATTATREALRLARRERRELSLEELEQSDDVALADQRPRPPEHAELAEWLASLGRLSPRQRRLLWSLAIGFSHSEILEREAGLTQRTLDRQIGRARKRLRAAA